MTNSPSDDTGQTAGDATPAALPRATIAPRPGFLARHASHAWWLAALALVVSIGLFVASSQKRGVAIRLRFDEGWGIEEGAALRHRGVDVGRVVGVRLAAGGDGVEVDVLLDASAAWLASEKSVFWIERPQVRLGDVRGLETIVGAKYLRVLPGPRDAPLRREFEGLESPLTLAEDAFEEIAIRFAEGHGIAPGDALRHRGVRIGDVVGVELDASLDSVLVSVRLSANASAVARAGSRFWIERPQFGFGGVRGIDTLVGGRYLAVWPGSPDEAVETRFEGLDAAPPSERSPGGLEIVVESSEASDLLPGVVVTYRGVRVGHVVSVGLASDGASVESLVFIDPAFVGLVCEDSVFWETSGFEMALGISGLEVNAGSLASLTSGGLAFATPGGQNPVRTGRRFRLADEEPADWTTWRPRLPVGLRLLPDGVPLPPCLRAKVTWETSLLGFRREHEATGWILPLDDGSVLGPRDLLSARAEAAEDTSRLEVAGGTIALDVGTEDGALRRVPGPEFLRESRWATSRMRRLEEAEDCILVADPRATALPIAAARLVWSSDGVWRLDGHALGPEWHGAAAISRTDGALIGFVIVGAATEFHALPRPNPVER